MEIKERFTCYNAVNKRRAEAGDRDVVEVMKVVPEGRLITIVEICKIIAKKHGVKACCSLTTGIFIMTAANAVEEGIQEDTRLDIPYWRTLKADGFLNEKYPGGAEAQKR